MLGSPLERSFILLLLLASFQATGQSFGFEHDPSIPVLDEGGAELEDPWVGGLNFCQFSRIDADRDGNEDLFVFDRESEKIEVFLYQEDQGSPEWVHSEAYDDGFPVLSGWVLLRDYNDDGKKDIFTSESSGIAVYKNTSSNGELSFEKMTGQLKSDHYPQDPNSNPINIYIQTQDIPAIDDIDGDGDLDILNFHILGTQVEYHRNVSLEETGSSDTLLFERRNACWGFFSEAGGGSSITLNDSCSGNVQDPEGNGSPGGQRHAGSTLLTLDMNEDGVKELVLGDLGSEQLTLLTNGGGPESSHMTNVTPEFPQSGLPVEVRIFPGAFFLDVDHDGVRDLVVSPNKGAPSVNRKSVWYYKNQGANDNPSFQLQKKNFLQDRMIDLGEGAFPVLFDIDGDGDKDLFIGNQYLSNEQGQQNSSIAYFENIGTSSDPEFQLQDRDYQALSQEGMADALYPAFGDLDGDGDPDLMVGDANGWLHYFENSSPVGSPASFTITQPQYEDDQGNLIDVGHFATPTLIDLDRDGLLDLVIGTKGGNLVHYENTGTSSNPSFTHRTDSLGSVMVKDPNSPEGYSVPSFYDMDGEYRLFVGSMSGKIHYYEGIEGNLDQDFDLISGDLGFLGEGKRSAPAVANMLGDERPEMILGDYGGGVRFLKGDEPDGIRAIEGEKDEFRIWPNPCPPGEELHLSSEKRGAWKSADPVLFDVQGRRIEVESFERRDKVLTVRLPELERGLYFIRPTPSGNGRRFLIR